MQINTTYIPMLFCVEWIKRLIPPAIGKDKTRCFPRDNVMEKTPCSPQGARVLMKEIFQGKGFKSLGDAVDNFVTFLKRHKSCPMKKLLNEYCPTDGGSYDENGKIKDVPYPQVIF